MNKYLDKLLDTAKRAQYLALAVFLSFAFLLTLSPTNVSAAQITSRKVTLSNSAGAGTGVTYTFNFTVPSATVLKSFQAEICTTASGACSTPAGWTGASSDLASQPTNYGDASGWTDASTSTALRMAKTANSAAPTGSQTVAFNGTVNPTANNTTFFARITTYSDDSYTTAVDSGVVAASTAQQITVTASVDESLTFCSGTSGVTTSSCAGATGSTVALGTLSASSTNSGSSQLGVGTNGGTGYSITINGTTLTSGGNTIDAMTGSSNTSTIGTEEFGVNLRDNATPNVGADPDGSGSGTPTADYNDVDEFKFVTTESIASKNAAELFRRFTVSYIANITTATEPGSYSATMTYICTATF